MRHSVLLLGILCGLLISTTSVRSQSVDANWHQWRGPRATGVSKTATPPLHWSESKNVQWKVPIEGNGTSTPIIWGNQVFLLTAIDTGVIDASLPKPEDQPERVFGIKHPNTLFQFVVLCLDRTTGKELWRQVATERVPHEGHHGDNDFASASPTTDGQRLYCWFGSAGFYCYDLNGMLLWKRELGKVYMGASLGEGSSPVVHNGKIVIVRDHSQQSSIEVLNAQTGETMWRKDRDEENTWATPRVVEHQGRTQVITTGSNFVRSYDLDRGEVIWQCSGLTGNCIPAPIVENDTVFCMSGYQGYSLLALPLSASGDISNSDAIRWKYERATPYIPSPLLYDGLLVFNQSNQNIVSALDSRSGQIVLDRTRVNGIDNIYASPVGAAGHIYVIGRNGTTVVMKRNRTLDVVATNSLDDRVDASPAVAGKQIFIRGSKSLYCIAE